jgi:Transposase domain (DUF772)
LRGRLGHCASLPIGEESCGGRPGIDPVVYFKMLMVGFFEHLPSERAIAMRCADSLSIRAFLGYGLEESTPDHSSLSVIRGRFEPEIYQGVFDVKELAKKEGVDPQEGAAVRRFDKSRPRRKTSNANGRILMMCKRKWRTKDGACDMIYKPEHVIGRADFFNGIHPI